MGRALLLLALWTQMSGCSDSAPRNADGAGGATLLSEADNGRLLLVGGERIDTTKEPGVAPLSAGRRRGNKPKGPMAQYYVQLEDGADAQLVSAEAGVGVFGDYVANSAFIVLTDLSGAQHLAAQPGVAWVGRRPARHKTVTNLLSLEPKQRRRAGEARKGANVLGADRLLVLLLPRAQLCLRDATLEGVDQKKLAENVEVVPCADAVEGVPGDASAAAAAWQTAFHAKGLSGAARAAGEGLVAVRVGEEDDVRAVAELLADRGEVAHLERDGSYQTLTNAANRIILDGEEDAEAAMADDRSEVHRKGLDGRGQMGGMADTGIDWDSCYFWESDGNPTFPDLGKPPPEAVDTSRRKIVAYTRYENCEVCNACPEDIPEDSQLFAASNGLIESQKDRRFLFPAQELASLSALPPRVYDSAGASVRFKLKARTEGTPSQYLAHGAGAFEVEANIQLFIVRAADLDTFDVDNEAAYATKCLNKKCSEKAPMLEETRLALPSSVNGFGIIIANRGAGATIGEFTPHIIIEGEIQFMTALKPCGDLGDDRRGHGTHVAGVMTGAAFTPESLRDQQLAAAKFDGVAPAAQLYFLDAQQNADPNCNTPGQACNRVNDLRVPTDLPGKLFTPAYDAGARVHLNSWGCEPVSGERPSSCNTYSIRSRAVDEVMYDRGDLLVVFAAGDRGLLEADSSLAEPATCKNCLTVGASEVWNEHYREAALHRDPMEDICPCEFPNFCSRSDTIGGQDVFTPEERLAALEPIFDARSCCNDTIHEFLAVKDVIINPGELYTVHFPNMSILYDDLMPYVKNKFSWDTKGSSVHYSFTAEEFGFTQVSSTIEKPEIQVMVIPRDFFIQYFEDGHAQFCDGTGPAKPGCRPNPCTSDLDGGDDTCMSMFVSGGVAQYQPLSGCASAKHGPGKQNTDKFCHKGGCLINTVGLSNEEKANDAWTEGCPRYSGGEEVQTCCNDAFLVEHCVNKPCDHAASTVEGIFRHETLRRGQIDPAAKMGYGLVVRNIGDRKIRITGNIAFHKKEYPCTLLDCCSVDPPAACCSSNYKRQFGLGNACAQCGPTEPLTDCFPNELFHQPPTSSRGPARNTYAPDAAAPQRRLKPDLVAPGTMVISANSDGAIPSTGPPEEYQVMCGKGAQATTDEKTSCFVKSAEFYSNKTATAVGGGTSVSAALVAGAALLVRQYLVDGFYPDGAANASNTRFRMPSAALLRAVLVNSAKGVTGSTLRNTYKYKPFCDPTVSKCPEWVAPPPVLDAMSLAGVPNFMQGFGRPVLRDSLYFPDSPFSLFLADSAIPVDGFMHTYTFTILGASAELPLRATLAWTDPPSAAGADSVVVNNLDLLVQLSTVQTLYEPNLGISVTRQVPLPPRSSPPATLCSA